MQFLRLFDEIRFTSKNFEKFFQDLLPSVNDTFEITDDDL